MTTAAFIRDTGRRWTSLLVSSLIVNLALAASTLAAEPPLIRMGHGGSNEEPVWLMSLRPDLTPNQGKRYQLKNIPFQGTSDRFQAYLAKEIDAGTAPPFSVLFARERGADLKIVASIIQESKSGFSTVFMVKDNGPIKSAADLKGQTIGILSPKTSPDFHARAYLLKSGLDPDKDVKLLPMPFPAMGPALRSDKIAVGAFTEPFYSAEREKGGLRPLFTGMEAVGFDHDLLDLWFGQAFIAANPDAVRAYLADYVAVTRYYLANKEQAKRELHKAGLVRAPIETYIKLLEYRRDPGGRVDPESLKRVASFMYEKLRWLDAPANSDEALDLRFLPQ
jgi:ABC-type nitrate/sulfonate/bicarbonate transport system substrate-binding protein